MVMVIVSQISHSFMVCQSLLTSSDGDDEDLLQANIVVLVVLRTSRPSHASNSTLSLDAGNRFRRRSALTKLTVQHSSS